jgi:hypothetical protein
VLVRLSLAVVLLVSCDSRGSGPPPIGDTRAKRECPTHFDLELNGAVSRFDPGYSGNAHGVGLATGSYFAVAVTTCDSECRRCRFHGPVPSQRSVFPVDNQRCLLDVTKTCTTDADCGGNPCRFMFPPIASKLVLETCSIAYLEPLATGDDVSAVQGVIDLDTGETDMNVFNLKVKLGIEACRSCQGDSTANDAVKGGTCTAGGGACDINGIGTVINANTSYDCPMANPGPYEIPLSANGTSTSERQWTMDATRPNCTAMGATTKKCWCGMCSNGQPCTRREDCPTGACGVATGPGGVAYNTNNHGCGMGTCNWDPAKQEGRCSNMATKPCFPDTGTIFARGTAEVREGFYIAQLANLLCMPSFDANGIVDLIGGFPGMLYFEARFRAIPRTVQ